MDGKNVGLGQPSKSGYVSQQELDAKRKAPDYASSLCSEKGDNSPADSYEGRPLKEWVHPNMSPSAADKRFIKLDPKDSVPEALNRLSKVLEERANGGHHLISHKKPANMGWIPGSQGQTVRPNEVAIYWHLGNLHVITQEGYYPQAGPFRTWDANPVESTEKAIITRGPLSILRLSQNVVAVAQDPAGKTFVMDQGQYVAYGNYRILEEVQPNNLANGDGQTLAYYENNDPKGKLLGLVRQVREDKKKDHSPVAATFLQVEQNCVAVVNRGTEFEVLHTGPWILTEKNVNLKGFFNESTTTYDMPKQRCRTADNVLVDVKVYIKYKLENPLLLAQGTSFTSPVAALQDAIKANLNANVNKLYFQNAAQMKDLTGGQVNGQQQSRLVADIQAHCADQLKAQASRMGIELEVLEVIECMPADEKMLATMSQLALKNAEIQNTAVTIDRDYDNKMKQQDYALQLAQREAATQNAKAEGDANAARKTAAGQRDAAISKAEGERDAAILAAEGKKQSQVKAAEGEKEVLILQTEAQNEALKKTANAKLEAAKAEAAAIEAIALAKANATKMLAEVQDSFGAQAQELARLTQQGENAKTLSDKFKAVVLPSSQNGEVNPLLTAVLQATVAKDALGNK